jgi:hypothetical protein
MTPACDHGLPQDRNMRETIQHRRCCDTRLVRMSVEMFEQLSNSNTTEVQVDWGEPVEHVWPLDDPQPHEQPVYVPTITRHFKDDMDEAEQWM